MSDLHDRLDELTGALRWCWRQAVELKTGREFWSEIRPALTGDYGNAGWMLWLWYTDWTLAGCRRLVDTSKKYGPRSLVNTLRGLHTIAPQVTPAVLAEVWKAQEFVHDEGDLEERARHELALIVHGGGDHQVDALTRRVVKDDEERLMKVHEAVVSLANRRVHASDPDDDVPAVTEDDVNALLDDVIAAANRWVGLIDRTELDDQPVRISGARPFRRALELFDWREYVEATGEEQHRRGPQTSRVEVEADVRVRYAFRDDTG